MGTFQARVLPNVLTSHLLSRWWLDKAILRGSCSDWWPLGFLSWVLGLVQLTVVRGQESPRCLAKVARSSGTLLRSADLRFRSADLTCFETIRNGAGSVILNRSFCWDKMGFLTSWTIPVEWSLLRWLEGQRGPSFVPWRFDFILWLVRGCWRTLTFLLEFALIICWLCRHVSTPNL